MVFQSVLMNLSITITEVLSRAPTILLPCTRIFGWVIYYNVTLEILMRFTERRWPPKGATFFH